MCKIYFRCHIFKSHLKTLNLRLQPPCCYDLILLQCARGPTRREIRLHRAIAPESINTDLCVKMSLSSTTPARLINEGPLMAEKKINKVASLFYFRIKSTNPILRRGKGQ